MSINDQDSYDKEIQRLHRLVNHGSETARTLRAEIERQANHINALGIELREFESEIVLLNGQIALDKDRCQAEVATSEKLRQDLVEAGQKVEKAVADRLNLYDSMMELLVKASEQMKDVQ